MTSTFKEIFYFINISYKCVSLYDKTVYVKDKTLITTTVSHRLLTLKLQ